MPSSTAVRAPAALLLHLLLSAALHSLTAHAAAVANTDATDDAFDLIVDTATTDAVATEYPSAAALIAPVGLPEGDSELPAEVAPEVPELSLLEVPEVPVSEVSDEVAPGAVPDVPEEVVPEVEYGWPATGAAEATPGAQFPTASGVRGPMIFPAPVGAAGQPMATATAAPFLARPDTIASPDQLESINKAAQAVAALDEVITNAVASAVRQRVANMLSARVSAMAREEDRPLVDVVKRVAALVGGGTQSATADGATADLEDIGEAIERPISSAIDSIFNCFDPNSLGRQLTDNVADCLAKDQSVLRARMPSTTETAEDTVEFFVAQDRVAEAPGAQDGDVGSVGQATIRVPGLQAVEEAAEDVSDAVVNVTKAIRVRVPTRRPVATGGAL